MSDHEGSVEFRIWPEGGVVRFQVNRGGVVVDAREHDFVFSSSRRRLRLAASRAGLEEAVFELKGAIGPLWSRDTLVAHLQQALLAAARAPWRGPADVDRVDFDDRDDDRGSMLDTIDAAWAAVCAVRSTPLVLCRGVLGNRQLLNDIVRFRPAAIAVASIEDLASRDRSVPEQTDAWAHRLRDWRSLYCARGSIARSVNRTLTRFGDDASAQALWGLRRVKLTAPLSTVQHVEVLGCLGARLPPLSADNVNDELQDIVLRASARELGEALVMMDEAGFDLVARGGEPPAAALAAVLSAVRLPVVRADLGRRLRFSDLLEVAMQGLRGLMRADAVDVIAPPVSLPSFKGITFLGTIGAILKEGAEMQHCVAMHAPAALAGDSYFFHIDHDGERATAEVGSDGVVREVRGPSNVDNAAVVQGQLVLRCWGARLALHHSGPPSTSLWSTPSPPLPAGCEPITTLGELIDVVVALTSPPLPGDDVVWEWATACVAEARGGKCWLAVTRAAGVALMLWLLDEEGVRVRSHVHVRALQIGHDVNDDE